MFKKIKNTVKSAWNYLDGKKTAIGGAMLFASKFVKPHTVAYQVLTIGGELLVPVGIAHKGGKTELASGLSEKIKLAVKNKQS